MSQGVAQDSANYIFRAKTKEAYVIKILGELLHNALIKRAPFRIDSEGIHLSQADSNNHQLINFTLFRENFFNYRATKPLYFDVNTQHFHKLLKTIKKKDTITLFIKDTKDTDECNKLGIKVETADEVVHTNTTIRITYIQPQVFNEPTGYPNPTICTNKEFQKMKNLQNISKEMEVTCPCPGLVRFYCDGGEIYEREVVLGNEQQCDDDIKDEEHEEFKQKFKTAHICGLTKAANQSGNVRIFTKKGLPLKIKMGAGHLGDLCVYIKSEERIKLEQKLEAEKEKQEVN